MIDSELRELVKRAVREALEEMGYRPPEPMPELVRISEVRRWIRLSPTTIKTWIREGSLKTYGSGKLLRVRLEDVRAVLERRRLKAVQQPPADVARILSSVPGGRSR